MYRRRLARLRRLAPPTLPVRPGRRPLAPPRLRRPHRVKLPLRQRRRHRRERRVRFRVSRFHRLLVLRVRFRVSRFLLRLAWEAVGRRRSGPVVRLVPVALAVPAAAHPLVVVPTGHRQVLERLRGRVAVPVVARAAVVVRVAVRVVLRVGVLRSVARAVVVAAAKSCSHSMARPTRR